MKQLHGICRVIILSGLLVFSAAAYASPPIEVAFSPDAGATALEVKAISEAKQSLRVAAYSFTSKPIAEALVAAHKRGVDVQVVLDKSNNRDKYTAATFLANMGIPTRIDSQYSIMHSKYMVIDGDTVETGSFNYTKAAERHNAENVIVIRDNPDLAKVYSQNWKRLWDESGEYVRTQH